MLLQIVKEAIAAGVSGYDAEIKQSVKKAAYGLRLTREVAMSIASKAVSIYNQLPFPLIFFSEINSGFDLINFVYECRFARFSLPTSKEHEHVGVAWRLQKNLKR